MDFRPDPLTLIMIQNAITQFGSNDPELAARMSAALGVVAATQGEWPMTVNETVTLIDGANSLMRGSKKEVIS